MPDPVAWIMIENGWKVFDAEGEDVAQVHEIAGDENSDIFDGIVIRHRTRGRDHYVPSEQVVQILEGEVHVSLTNAEIEALADYTEPVEEQILPEKSSWYQRLAWWTTGRNR